MKTSIQCRLPAALLAVGIAGGLVGIVLTGLLHFVQHHAYGYTSDGGYQSFREGVAAAAPWRRFAVMVLCGAVAGAGWQLLKKYGRPLTGIKAAADNPRQGMPFATTIVHALLQIVTVGMGSPLGREVAPREMTAAFASHWAKRLALGEQDARLLVACASGAGLAAVYNVPLAGALFALETVLASWSQRAAAAALFCSVSAAAVAQLALGDVQQYPLPDLPVEQTLLPWALAAGPVLGAAAALFRRSVSFRPLLWNSRVKAAAFAVAAFALIGALAAYCPEILGNGKAGNQLVFGGLTGWQGSLKLLVLKWSAVLLALAAGAYGGLITPSMLIGATPSLHGAFLWNTWLPAVRPESAAVVGAAVFLGVAQRMPLTATVFVLEMTRASAALLLPLCACMALALAVSEKAEGGRAA